MALVSVSSFLSAVEAIAAKNPTYRLGGSGKDGTCDCIGLIMGAIRTAGSSWPGLHGSNYAARNETVSLSDVSSVSALKPGELVYKVRNPGESGYALPDRYKSGSDLRDYYHVGVVLSVSPLRIRHMSTPGMLIDTKLGNWRRHGWCKRIALPEEAAGKSGTAPAEGSAGTPDPAEKILTAVGEIENQLDVIRNLLDGNA